MSNIERCPRCGATSPVVQGGVCGGCVPPNLDKCTMFRGTSRTEIEGKIDVFLAEEKPFKDVPLILTADGQSSRYTYKGISIREWHCAGNVRHDAAVELTA